jgi:rare lipoprotein A
MKRIYILTLILCLTGICNSYIISAQNLSGGDVFRQEGIASWYGTEFDGRPTASGEIFNSSLFTAAHPNLPFGTLLSVTNTHNNTYVTFKLNDRGPFVSARIIDISMAAAEELDMITTGTAPVFIQSIDKIVTPGRQSTEIADDFWNVPPALPPEPPAPVGQMPGQRAEMVPAQPKPPEREYYPEPAAAPEYIYQQPAQIIPEQHRTVQPVRQSPAVLIPNIAPVQQKKYRLQAGSFKVAKNAVETFEKLKNAGLNPKYERYEDYFRVVLPDIPGYEVYAVTEKLGSVGIREALIREER